MSKKSCPIYKHSNYERTRLLGQSVFSAVCIENNWAENK